MNDNKLYFTKEGLLVEQQKLEKLKEEFYANEKMMTQAFHNSSGDGAHDNAEFEDLLMKERQLVNAINTLTKKIESAIIIDKPELSEEYINIDDEVTVLMQSSDMEDEEFTVKLIGSVSSPFK